MQNVHTNTHRYHMYHQYNDVLHMFYVQVPRFYTRLVLQTVCWLMLATGALAITTVLISSIYSLFYVIVKCKLPP